MGNLPVPSITKGQPVMWSSDCFFVVSPTFEQTVQQSVIGTHWFLYITVGGEGAAGWWMGVV